MKKLIAVLTLVGFATLFTGCQKEEAPGVNAADANAMEQEMNQMGEDMAGATEGEEVEAK